MVGGVVEVVDRPGLWPSLGGQQEQGIPGRHLLPSHPGGRLNTENIGQRKCF